MTEKLYIESTLLELVETLPQGHKARQEFKELQEKAEKFESLCAHGVDNWGGWDDAMQEFWD
jgi:hypothetical protein